MILHDAFHHSISQAFGLRGAESSPGSLILKAKMHFELKWLDERKNAEEVGVFSGALFSRFLLRGNFAFIARDCESFASRRVERELSLTCRVIPAPSVHNFLTKHNFVDFHTRTAVHATKHFQIGEDADRSEDSQLLQNHFGVLPSPSLNGISGLSSLPYGSRPLTGTSGGSGSYAVVTGA